MLLAEAGRLARAELRVKSKLFLPLLPCFSVTELVLSVAEGRSRKACGIATLRAQPKKRSAAPLLPYRCCCRKIPMPL